MKYAQKLVLVPIEEWDKVKQKDLPLKQVTVNTIPQKVATFQQQGLGKIPVKNLVEKKLKDMILCLTPKRRTKALNIETYKKIVKILAVLTMENLYIKVNQFYYLISKL